MDISEEIRERLFSLRDPAYRELQLGLLPTVSPGAVIGVRTPALRKLAGELAGREEAARFLALLPHGYFEENQLHAFLLSREKDPAACIRGVDRFLPYVDNWATCDQMAPAAFRKSRAELPEHVRRWIASGKTYTVRFGIKTLMDHFLDEAFDPAWPALVAAVRSDEYYVNMMIAWYFATALAKRYEEVLPVLEEKRLAAWTHNKTIQKAAESFRIPPEHKAYLRTLKVRREP